MTTKEVIWTQLQFNIAHFVSYKIAEQARNQVHFLMYNAVASQVDAALHRQTLAEFYDVTI